jgi:RNA polymerase sigma factor (TIGR02999 family)
MSQSHESTPGEITLLLQRADRGDAQAADLILPLVYGELRRLAAAKMARERPGQTLQATALVHEAWLRLGGDQQPEWKNRAHFFAAAAESMRRILIESARRRRAQRHGGGLKREDINATGFDVAAPALDDTGLILLDEALGRLAAHDERKAEIIKHCFFVGLTLEEAAQAMGISDRTAKRDWAYARAWLFNEMKALQQANSKAPASGPK